MAGSKEIRDKIKSIKNTRKITKAMQMVAASKMRRFQDRMIAARPYAERIRRVIGHLAHANPEYRHPYLVTRTETKNVGYVVITSDRGLCGGLNSNLLRTLTLKMREAQRDGMGVQFCSVGTKGSVFLKRSGAKIVSSINHLGDTPRIVDGLRKKGRLAHRSFLLTLTGRALFRIGDRHSLFLRFARMHLGLNVF